MTHTKATEISSLGETEQLAPCGDMHFLEWTFWQHSNLSVHQWLISSKKSSLSLVMPNHYAQSYCMIYGKGGSLAVEVDQFAFQ